MFDQVAINIERPPITLPLLLGDHIHALTSEFFCPSYRRGDLLSLTSFDRFSHMGEVNFHYLWFRLWSEWWAKLGDLWISYSFFFLTILFYCSWVRVVSLSESFEFCRFICSGSIFHLYHLFMSFTDLLNHFVSGISPLICSGANFLKIFFWG